jgi:hypothetical protein
MGDQTEVMAEHTNVMGGLKKILVVKKRNGRSRKTIRRLRKIKGEDEGKSMGRCVRIMGK